MEKVQEENKITIIKLEIKSINTAMHILQIFYSIKYLLQNSDNIAHTTFQYSLLSKCTIKHLKNCDMVF